MRLALSLHPDSRCEAAHRIEVEVSRPRPETLVLDYLVTGDVAGLVIPPPRLPRRADGLWRHTCFEAFIRAPGHSSYHEFNFAPSMEWAAYRFSGYRSGMSPAGDHAPALASRQHPDWYALSASVQLDTLAGLPLDGPLRVALSAVIEEKGGCKSYWALAHQPGNPDFHHPGNFTLDIAAEQT
jgi:hypothetical protein